MVTKKNVFFFSFIFLFLECGGGTLATLSNKKNYTPTKRKANGVCLNQFWSKLSFFKSSQKFYIFIYYQKPFKIYY